MKILVVEDDKTIRSFVVQGLREEGYVVTATANGQEGFELLQASSYDFLVLDLMLPGMDGLALCRSMRDRNINIPVLMLTAKDSIDDRVKGLDAGADDYLVKPFSFVELLARIRAVARRKSGEGQTVIEVDGLSVDLVRHKVIFGGKELELPNREFNLLQYFLKRKGHVLSRTMIIESVWGYDFHSGTNIIDVYINFLRRKLKTLTGKDWIRTIRNRGYVFETEIR